MMRSRGGGGAKMEKRVYETGTVSRRFRKTPIFLIVGGAHTSRVMPGIHIPGFRDRLARDPAELKAEEDCAKGGLSAEFS